MTQRPGDIGIYRVKAGRLRSSTSMVGSTLTVIGSAGTNAVKTN